ncbi:MAG TPA: nucleotidyltransferase domain-containing protein [Candidatus Thermoplasmatota archaeon]
MGELRLPENVRASLATLVADLERAAGPTLVGVVLYGGLARGRYRPGQSDVNVLIVLREGGLAGFDAVAPVLRAAWRKDRVDPLVMAVGELQRAAEEFPVKFLDIRRTHVLLAGSDPLAGLEIPDRLVRHRLGQELNNLTLRLRRRYVLEHDDLGEVARMLAGSAMPLCVQLEALLEVDGRPPARDDCTAVFDAAAESYALDRGTLAELEALRRGDGVPDPRALLGQTLVLIQTVLEAARPKGVSP